MAQEFDDEWHITDARKRWESVRVRLKAEVGEAVFDRFLQPVALVGAERSRVRLGAASRFLRDFIASNFAERLHRLWRAERPEIIAVDIVISDVPPPVPVEEADSAAASHVVIETARGPQIAPGAPARNLTGLIPSFRFDNFVKGSSNALAAEAARRVAAEPGARYNPLFIHGPTGVGKTHLEHAIGNAVLAARPDARVRYVSAERFLSLFLSSIAGRTALAFKEEFRSIDVLLIDDLQYIAGVSREVAQKEFLHTLNALIAENRQVVITADAAPGALTGFDDSIRSRLGGGMVVDISETDSALRLGILTNLRQRFEATQQESKRKPVAFAPDVLPFLADRLVTNGRELTGAFNQISGRAEFEGQVVTIEFVQQTLKDVLQGTDRPPTIEEIVNAVSNYMGIKVADMKGERRTQDMVRARHMAWWLCRALTERSYPQIAHKFGRDHTTVLAGRRRIEKLKERDAKLAEDLEALTKIIQKK